MFLTVLALAMAAPQCTGQPDLPRALAGWTRKGTGLDTKHATTFKPRDGRIETRVTIRKPGVFGIAIDRKGWIDVAPPRGEPLRMLDENRGPRCSGIRKIVRYRLRAGEYRVSVGRVEGAEVKLMLVRGAPR